MIKRAKGRRYPFELACVAWGDLLGYGGMLESAKFHTNDKATSEVISRLRSFHQAAMEEAKRSFRAMPINDGIAYFCDLSPRSNSVTADFLQRTIRAFDKINALDKKAGFPGMRMVLAVGPRARIARPKRSGTHLRRILSRLGGGEISPEQAVNEAFRSDPVAGFVPALQANFAFTRAYVAESGGKEKGFPGPHLFIDLALFNDPLPDWIKFSRSIDWCDRGFSGRFGQYKSVDWPVAGQSHFLGIKPAQEIADAVGMEKSYGLT